MSINFKNVHHYMKTAKCDDEGFHDMTEEYPKIKIQIYDNHREANFMLCTAHGINNQIPLGKLIIEEDRVSMFPIDPRNWAANFDHGIHIDRETNIDIDNAVFIRTCIDAYGSRAGFAMADILFKMSHE